MADKLAPKATRVKRTPINTRNVLAISGATDPNRQYRVVTDQGDRVSQFIERGWRIETDPNISLGDRRVGKSEGAGSPVQASVGSGQKAFLMSIDKEWFDEDQTEKQKLVDESEAVIKEKALDGTYGKLDISRK